MKKSSAFKVTVYGGTNNKEYPAEHIAACERLGAHLAEVGAVMLTGACRGLPYYAGKAAAKAGGRVIGYTPARNKKEHVERFQFPLDGVTELVYTRVKGVHNAESFLKRSWDMTPFSDLVIAMGGSWGTFTELIFSFWYKKTIILVEDFGGAVQAFDDAYKFFGARDNNPDVHRGPNIIRVKDVEGAIAEIERYRTQSK
jgi:predicted Rossmann-fold nucleotide-binding protein